MKELKTKRNQLVMVAQGLATDKHIKDCLNDGIYTEADLVKTREALTQMTAECLKDNLLKEMNAEYTLWNENRNEEKAAQHRIEMKRKKEENRVQQLKDKRVVQEAAKMMNKNVQPKKKRKESKNKKITKNPIGKNETNFSRIIKQQMNTKQIRHSFSTQKMKTLL